MFMTALNVSAGWDRYLAEIPRTRHYDVEIRLNQAEVVAPLVDGVRSVPGVRSVEAWGYTSTVLAQPGQVDLARTYPDRGHGSFAILAPPATSALVTFPVMAGRWPQPGDTDAVVLNHMALGQAPNLKVGSSIALSIDGRPTYWRVVGIVQEIGSPAAAYAIDEAFARVSGTAGRARMLRIAATARDPEARNAVIRRVERVLEKAGVGVAFGIPLSELRTAMGDHVVVLTRSLVAVAILMATVGALGLLSAMSMNVLERTRELGVMRTIGGHAGRRTPNRQRRRDIHCLTELDRGPGARRAAFDGGRQTGRRPGLSGTAAADHVAFGFVDLADPRGRRIRGCDGIPSLARLTDHRPRGPRLCLTKRGDGIPRALP